MWIDLFKKNLKKLIHTNHFKQMWSAIDSKSIYYTHLLVGDVFVLDDSVLNFSIPEFWRHLQPYSGKN